MIFEKVKSIIVSSLDADPDSVTMETYFVEDLGADSLDVMQLVNAFEAEFGAEFDSDSLDGIKQVKDVVSYFENI